MPTPNKRPSLVGLVIALNDSLSEAGVGHGFGGALALAYYTSQPRTTSDIDINIASSIEMVAEVFKVLPHAISWDTASIAQCKRDGQIRLWCGQPQKGIPVDLFFPQHEFHESVAAAVSMHPFGTEEYLIPIISAAHLAVFKALYNRPKDWVDISEMLLAGSVDVLEVDLWLERLLGTHDEVLQRFRQLAGDGAVKERNVRIHPKVDPIIPWQSLRRGTWLS